MPLLVLGCAFAFLTVGCPLPSSDSVPISVLTESITLAWDPPSIRSSPLPLAITAYRIYYAAHNSGRWFFLGEIPVSDHPEFAVHHVDVGDGSFDFAVSSVNN
jgi:hypothetical protein